MTTEVADVCQADAWERAPPDPDPTDDLGYRIAEWESHQVRYSDGDKVVLVPVDEDAFDSEAYIVADEGAVVDTLDRC